MSGKANDLRNWNLFNFNLFSNFK